MSLGFYASFEKLKGYLLLLFFYLIIISDEAVAL